MRLQQCKSRQLEISCQYTTLHEDHAIPGQDCQTGASDDPATGDVVLSRKPTDWQGLLDVVAQNKEDDLLIERRQTHARRDPFEGC